jgi:dTDP-4-dehydrorhamnose reductase
MAGSAIYRYFAQQGEHHVIGVARSSAFAHRFGSLANGSLHIEPDVLNLDRLIGLLADTRPDVVVNCIGIIKQHAYAEDSLAVVPVNSNFPHRLAQLCRLSGARLIHISTDCVFSGAKGNYLEIDQPDATDLYGRSKLLGEVDAPMAITLRTSIIGHEFNTTHSLVDWFLSQTGRTNGYTKAIFSGMPTVELARVIRDYVLPNPQLSGVYHVSAHPISKFDLLTLVAKTYGKDIEITPVDKPVIDRSLNSDRFRTKVDYRPPDWPTLIHQMREFN